MDFFNPNKSNGIAQVTLGLIWILSNILELIDYNVGMHIYQSPLWIIYLEICFGIIFIPVGVATFLKRLKPYTGYAVIFILWVLTFIIEVII